MKYPNWARFWLWRLRVDPPLTQQEKSDIIIFLFLVENMALCIGAAVLVAYALS